MPAIGMGLLWGGYSLIFWGYCQLRGYDISLGDMMVPGRAPKWPPPIYNDGGSSSGGMKSGDACPSCSLVAGPLKKYCECPASDTTSGGSSSIPFGPQPNNTFAV